MEALYCAKPESASSGSTYTCATNMMVSMSSSTQLKLTDYLSIVEFVIVISATRRSGTVYEPTANGVMFYGSYSGTIYLGTQQVTYTRSNDTVSNTSGTALNINWFAIGYGK